jgi:hypothetical protein
MTKTCAGSVMCRYMLAFEIILRHEMRLLACGTFTVPGCWRYTAYRRYSSFLQYRSVTSRTSAVLATAVFLQGIPDRRRTA